MLMIQPYLAFDIRYSIGSSGIMNKQMRYAHTPANPNNIPIANMQRIIVESTSKYCAIPPHTPLIFLSVLDL